MRAPSGAIEELQIEKANSSQTAHVVLAGYQRRAVEALATEIAITHTYIARAVVDREEIARSRGTCLLCAPTGSGKTLMIGRTLETLVPDPVVPAAGFKGSVWFWFTPYAGLVEQTRLALRRDCRSLRPRDLFNDREPSFARDGDVFIQTWASVAANNKEARKLRRSTEQAFSVDEMIEDLRSDGWFIGAVIDEAHLNFGTTAQAAADFYIRHLRPDVAILATATPNDAKLRSFQTAAGIKDVARVEIARDAVVQAGLNKRGLVLATLHLTDQQKLAIDPEEAILRAAWIHHTRIRRRLADRNIDLKPLLLVQVPDANPSDMDPPGRVRDMLLNSIGVPREAISIHTSGQPDPAFHALANDDRVEVLVFKLAAATGFDAPRAWSLASLRPSVSPDFGMQVVGRIMRVHRLIRPIHGQDPLLDRGTVFLAEETRAMALEAAAGRLKALRSSIEPVAEQLSILDLGEVLGAYEGEIDDERPTHEVELVDEIQPPQSSSSALKIADAVSQFCALQEQEELFAGVLGGGIKNGTGPKSGQSVYLLRRDLDIPHSLQTERVPRTADLPALATDAAAAFEIDDNVLALLVSGGVEVELRLRELLLSTQERTERLSVRPSPAKLAEAAQLAFSFHEDIDPRAFRKALVDRFALKLTEAGAPPQDASNLRRVIDQIAVYQPERLHDAMRRAMGKYIRVEQAEPLPSQVVDADGLFAAHKAAYGVFPSRLNGPERRFAETIDELPEVKWWLRNPDHPQIGWSVRIVLPNGRGFYPDFVIGVAGRKAPHGIRLVEVKDDGTTGRLHADVNQMKIRTLHREYLQVLWVSEEQGEGRFSRLVYAPERNRITATGPFSANLLIQD